MLSGSRLMKEQIRKMSAVIYVESRKITAICSIGLLNSCILLINAYSRMDHEAQVLVFESEL